MQRWCWLIWAMTRFCKAKFRSELSGGFDKASLLDAKPDLFWFLRHSLLGRSTLRLVGNKHKHKHKHRLILIPKTILMGANCARRGQQTQTNEKITLCNNQTTYLRRYVKNGICLFSFHKKGKGVTVLSTIRMNFATGWLLPVGRMMEWQGYTGSGRPIFIWCSWWWWWWWKSGWTRNRIGWGYA